jgi:hypothetical protein
MTMTGAWSWIRRRRWALVMAFVVVGAFQLDRVDLRPTPVYTNSAGQHFRGYSPLGALQQPTGDDVAAVERQLDIRAHAVLDGDRAAFLGVADTDRTSFTLGQRTVWSNTRRLPFEKLSYSYDGVLEPDAPLSTASFLVRVTTTYQLRGYDSSPVQVDDGFTFVKQDGSWKLASVTDADRQFNKTSLPVPWDGAAIDTSGDGDYLVVVDRGRRAVARHILALCHEGSRASKKLLGAAKTPPTVVLATSHATGYHTFVGLDFAAVTYPLRGPDGVTPGWRVFVNPKDVAEVAASPIVVPHELAHLATQDYLAVSPSWLVEGAAEYAGWHAHGGLRAELKERNLAPPLKLAAQLPDSRTFYRQNEALDYAEGAALVSWLEEHEGRGAVLSLMRAYADVGGFKVDFDPDQATPGILRETFGITPDELARSAYAEMDATFDGS